MAIITLTTDFGWRDGYVGAVKGVISRLVPEAKLVDIAHDIPRGDVAHAAWVVKTSTLEFPHETIHVVVVDPGVGSARPAVIAQAPSGHPGDPVRRRQLYVGPDNGVFSYLPIEKAWAIRMTEVDAAPSATFHGRDVFAPLAAAIASGRCNPRDLGDEVDTFDDSGWPRTMERADGGVSGVIVAVDRFGNLISNIGAARVVALANPTIHIGGMRLPLRRTYGEAAAGDYLGLINSFEVLEVARSRGSAAAGLNLAVGAPISAVPAVPGAQFRRS